VNFALEMIDIVVDEALKHKLIPLIDVIPDEDKVKALYQFYPGEIPEYEELIEEIINRDYNLAGIWIRACAIRSLTGIKSETLGESLVALLFSPEMILQEETARLLARCDREIYRSASERLPSAVKSRLDPVINGEIPDGGMMFEKTVFLSEIFTGLTREDLLLPAGQLVRITEMPSAGFEIPGGFVLWKVVSGIPAKAVMIGSPGKKEIEAFSKGSDFLYLLPLNTIKDYNFRFPEKSDEILEYIEINES
jgi:hypothetical protein